MRQAIVSDEDYYEKYFIHFLSNISKQALNKIAKEFIVFKKPTRIENLIE